jgi:hypothetical protein
MAELNPLVARYGRKQGRLIPVSFTPTDGAYAYVLGSEALSTLDYHEFAAGDFVEIYQEMDLTDVKLIVADARYVQPSDMPIARDISSGATLKRGSVINAGDDLSAIVAPNANFTFHDVRRPMLVDGAVDAFNNTLNRIMGLVDQSTAVLFKPVHNEVTGFTATMRAALWELSITVDYNKIVSIRLGPGSDWTTDELSANVSKISGLLRVGLRLELADPAYNPTEIWDTYGSAIYGSPTYGEFSPSDPTSMLGTYGSGDFSSATFGG